MPENEEPTTQAERERDHQHVHGNGSGDPTISEEIVEKSVAGDLQSHNQEPEKDEFGLPIRKARRRTISEVGSDERSSDMRSPTQDPFQDPEDHGGEEKAHNKDSVSSEEELHTAPKAVTDAEATSENIEVNIRESKEDTDSKELEKVPEVQDPPLQEDEKFVLRDIADEPRPADGRPRKRSSAYNKTLGTARGPQVSEFSHQQLAPNGEASELTSPRSMGDEWQEMPAIAPYDIYDDDGKLVAREDEDSDDGAVYRGIGGAGKGYTRVQIDDDAQSATSMDDNTAYLFKDPTTTLADDDEDVRDPLSQMQATKDLLTEGQRIAYVGVTRVAIEKMVQEMDSLEKTKGAKKALELGVETMQMWSQKMMLRLYQHMEVNQAEQIMIEQLAEHGVEPSDLTPALMANARVKNPVADNLQSSTTDQSSATRPPNSARSTSFNDIGSPRSTHTHWSESVKSPPPTASTIDSPPPYKENPSDLDLPAVRTPSQLPHTTQLDIDLRWTVLCDLFLVLISDSQYDARSRALLEKVADFMSIDWLNICRFEKRVTDALEMQEAADKENWNEEGHMENRRKLARKRRLVMMGLATVGGSLVIGLSAGLLAPVIGAGLAAGFTTIGVAGTEAFLAGAGGAAIVSATGVATGAFVGGKAANRRTGAVKTFEYKPLHNNKRVNLIVTVAGWMTGKVDDVRLPFSTVDPVMGDIYSVLWEPDMLTSMGQTINILATEALTQSVQQILGSTILVALMAGLQLPIVLSKLSYLIDNPWNVSLARAELAGLILADSLIDRNLGARPITLVGYSLGCRLIFSCLKELAKKGAHGLVQNVYMFGSPLVANKDEFLKVRTVVCGRWVNGYSTNDWILGYLFRATSGGIGRVAGLAPVNIPGIENHNVTEIVDGHMAYRKNMPRLLREAGWIVESDEFTEIEDPDPDNHEKRQRELISEIEEARQKVEAEEAEKTQSGWKKKAKFGLGGIWGPKKKAVKKKEWEMYDERLKSTPDGNVDHALAGEGAAGVEGIPGVKDDKVLFDVDAIRQEAAELAAQGIEIKQLESTLGPMKLEVQSPSPTNSWNGINHIPPSPRDNLRHTQSYDTPTTLSHRPSIESATSNTLHPLSKARTYDDTIAPRYSTEGHSSISSRDPSPRPPLPIRQGSPGRSSGLGTPAEGRLSWETSSRGAGGSQSNLTSHSNLGSQAHLPMPQQQLSDANGNGYAKTSSGVGLGINSTTHNAWAEDTEYKGGGGMEMTFE
ncbi:MAG: hypothetical protein M1820_006398 [Bogoriella megaspora]|nr:MAG: hypothetical protein M1820_006398 [Bogoriella megaspora]